MYLIGTNITVFQYGNIFYIAIIISFKIENAYIHIYIYILIIYLFLKNIRHKI